MHCVPMINSITVLQKLLPLQQVCWGDGPEERVAWMEVVKCRAKLQLGIVSQVVLD